MTLNDKDKKTLAEYDFRLSIRHKVDKNLGTRIDIDGSKSIEHLFLDEVLTELAEDLRLGEKQFISYKKQGFITQDKDGNWNLSDKHAQAMVGNGIVIDKNDPKTSVIEHITDKKDFKNGPVEIKD